jgi:tetratricopeptide (TPR) repeat protein
MRRPRADQTILVAVLCLCGLLPLSNTAAQAPLRTNPGKVLGFAHHLFVEGDTYRAVTEYQAFIFLFPRDPRVPEARYFLGKSYEAQGEWEAALNAFQQVIHKEAEDRQWAVLAALEIGKTLTQAGQPAAAARFLEEAARRPQWSDIRNEALYRAAWDWLGARQWEAAVRALRSIETGTPLADPASQLQKEIDRGLSRLPHRNPWVAGGLAAVLPGSGHLYIGRPKEALTSFLLNSAFIAGTVWAIQEGYPVSGGILAFFELSWYAGGISTAFQGARRYHEIQEQKWLQGLENRWGPDRW